MAQKHVSPKHRDGAVSDERANQEEMWQLFSATTVRDYRRSGSGSHSYQQSVAAVQERCIAIGENRYEPSINCTA